MSRVALRCRTEAPLLGEDDGPVCAEEAREWSVSQLQVDCFGHRDLPQTGLLWSHSTLSAKNVYFLSLGNEDLSATRGHPALLRGSRAAGVPAAAELGAPRALKRAARGDRNI